MANYTLAIHGGAGTILKKNMTLEKETAYRQALEESLNAGIKVLSNGGSALDAVLASVISLEDNILFNAGKGSVFASDGSHEMDASIMDGKSLEAGSVSAVRKIRNPIQLAMAVLQKSPHVMLQGLGAYQFALKERIAVEDEDYFFSQFRYDQWQQAKKMDSTALDHNIELTEKKFGTVGAVAFDSYGNLAAATSTGGMTNKQYGRVGDSPVIGAGTYANNRTCAISCTGNGEAFIRAVAAYDISCLMEYKGLSLQAAMEIVVNDKLPKLDGEGGMIGVDNQGNASLVFNSEGMYRGFEDNKGNKEIAIYKSGIADA